MGGHGVAERAPPVISQGVEHPRHRPFQPAIVQHRAPLRQEVAIGVELLNILGDIIGDIDHSGGVRRQAEWLTELSVARAEAAPLGQEVSIGIEFLNTIVKGVGDINIGGAIHGDGEREIELAIA